MGGLTYKDSGVDVNAGYRSVELIKKHVKRTLNPNVLGGLNSFAGLYNLDVSRYASPVLVSGTDGVGTKLKIAFELDKHDTIGQDCVAMCVNDVVCQGAEPLFFLDYIATGKNYPERIEKIVKGISDGCVQAGCALIGGETAEMPGFYDEEEYDLAGFCVGIVDKDNIITGKSIKEGNIIIGLASSGVHSNGYSLVRKLFMEKNNSLFEHVDELGTTIGEELLKPTRIYVKDVLEIMDKYRVNGIVHITGGGFYENIPRILPDGLQAVIDLNAWQVPGIFKLIQSTGKIQQKEMFNTFNMGIGMAIIVDKDDCDGIMETLNKENSRAFTIGEIKTGDSGVSLC